MSKKYYNLFFWMLSFWLLLTMSLTLKNLIVGTLGIIVIIIFLNYLEMEVDLILDWNFKKVFGWMKYLADTLSQIVKANVDVAERVLDPSLPIEPTIVKLKIPFSNNPFLFTMLANTITLTPGTLVVDYEGDYIYVHFLAEEYIDLVGHRHLAKKIMKIFAPDSKELKDMEEQIN